MSKAAMMERVSSKTWTVCCHLPMMKTDECRSWYNTEQGEPPAGIMLSNRARAISRAMERLTEKAR